MAQIRVDLQTVLDFEVTLASPDSKYYLRMSRAEWESLGRPDFIETDLRPMRFTYGS
jgi:hypothetical protein